VNFDEPTVDDVIEQLGLRRADALNTLDILRAERGRIEADAALLESPQAVYEYIDFFITSIEEVVAECDRIAGELPQGVQRWHIEMLRQIAANSRTEQRRCLVFRDKCINRPLPHESMRPLLNDISVTTRDQLTAFFDLNNAAARLERIINTTEPQPDPRRVYNRRRLFTSVTSLFKLPKRD
jgi:hypothetical protein